MFYRIFGPEKAGAAPGQCPWSCGTVQVAVEVATFPAKSVALAVRVYIRPVPVPKRSARSFTTRAPEPLLVMTISGFFASEGSLLLPVTVNEPGASPDSASVAVTEATCTSLPFGGQRLQPMAGIPEMTGGVVSAIT